MSRKLRHYRNPGSLLGGNRHSAFRRERRVVVHFHSVPSELQGFVDISVHGSNRMDNVLKHHSQAFGADRAACAGITGDQLRLDAQVST